MGYRKLTEREITIFIEEQAVYERWRSYAAYALKIHGPQAAQVVVESDLVYNDETNEQRITELMVLDATGQPLDPDWTSDWWQTTLGDRYAAAVAQPWDPLGWDDPRNLVLYHAQQELPVPPQRDVFTTSTAPERRFPAVYVPNEGYYQV